MRSTLACVRLRECTLACSMELRGNTCNSASICCAVPTPCSEIFLQVFPRKLRTQVVLHGVVNMQLPNQWLWDMVDEFVYQFQSFCQYQAKMKTKTEQEISLLKQFDQHKQYYQKLPQYDQILKKNEQMYALLAVSLSLCPQMKLVNSQLQEKYNEKMLRMQRCDDEAFVLYDELFSSAFPKFITASAPNYEEPLVNYNQDAYRFQLKLFLH
ncbi:hypothetical protein POM88_036127 [Heracleum sosnowskyi]|uniref:Uncharacterized protein n=1 Tax=Heracleum sosnowskyi TaxID=360622 RepID=A0AAD8MC56_9APIA|nr:hypothetical protein POM88_036127 [Heracleum sosnowskyi]